MTMYNFEGMVVYKTKKTPMEMYMCIWLTYILITSQDRNYIIIHLFHQIQNYIYNWYHG